jgi:hypothetical protein
MKKMNNEALSFHCFPRGEYCLLLLLLLLLLERGEWEGLLLLVMLRDNMVAVAKKTSVLIEYG